MATHGCVSYPCPICHASAIAAAHYQLREEYAAEIARLNRIIDDLRGVEDPSLPDTETCPTCKREVHPIQIYDYEQTSGCVYCHGVQPC